MSPFAPGRDALGHRFPRSSGGGTPEDSASILKKGGRLAVAYDACTTCRRSDPPPSRRRAFLDRLLTSPPKKVRAIAITYEMSEATDGQFGGRVDLDTPPPAGSLPELDAVATVIASHAAPGTDLRGLKATHVNPNSDGSLRVLYERPSSSGPPLRVAARQLDAERGRRYEAELNAASGGLRRSAVYSDELGYLLQFFPADQRLAALPAAVDRYAMAAILETALAGDRPKALLDEVDIEVVRYKPARKCLLRYRLTWSGRGASRQPNIVYGKLTEPDRLEQSHQMLLRIHAAAAKQRSLRLPEPLGSVRHLGMQLFSHVAGVPLFSIVASPEFVAHSAQLGHVLYAFHNLDVKLARSWNGSDYKRQLMVGAREFADLWPDQRGRIATAAGVLAMWLESTALPARPRLTHGDFHGNNVLVDGKDLALIDIEDCVLGDPADDVASQWAEMTLLALGSGSEADHARAGQEAFVKAYTSLCDAETTARLPMYSAIRCFLLAYQRARRADLGHDEIAEQLLGVCEDFLQIVDYE